jgi:AcrR family transcriptional regulator
METRKVGRPRSASAAAHARIMDAVYDLLQTTAASDLTMEAVAARAGVGKPTLYKWWPSKAALILAMFGERIALQAAPAKSETVEATIRVNAARLIAQFKGLFGKVIRDLIAEGQSEPDVLHALFNEHIRPRRDLLAAQMDAAKTSGELDRAANPELAMDAIFGALYFRFLLRIEPLDKAYGDALVAQVFSGLHPRPAVNVK